MILIFNDLSFVKCRLYLGEIFSYHKIYIVFWGIFLSLFLGSNFAFSQPQKYPEKLLRFHAPMPKPKLGEWLSQHTENGQTLAEYIAQKPMGLSQKRRQIYLLPLGNQTPLDSQILHLTAEYLEAFFGQNVIVQHAIMDLENSIPEGSQRTHHQEYQIHTRFVLYDILQKNLPSDALTYVALSSVDLYPDPKWNFVFGEATLRRRVAVVSSYRHKIIWGNLPKKQQFAKTALRVLKTTTHEIGHTFSMRHCVAYHCLMNGSNNQRESDRQPWHLCPICSEKLDYALKTNLRERYVRLRDFFVKYGFRNQAKFCRKILRHLPSKT